MRDLGRITKMLPESAQRDAATSRTVEIVNHSVASEELLKATREITIRHGEDVYRLRLTAQNKLILTK